MGRLSGGAGARMMDGVRLLSVAHAPGTSRDAARQAIRAALCADVAAVLGATDVQIAAVPGTRPRLLQGGALAPVGIAISHTDAYAFAAWHPSIDLGIDVMAVTAVPEWRSLARDYLGPQALARLEGVAPDARERAFAREWTAREASLKCQGLGLSEWSAEVVQCRLMALTLPAGYVGMLAVAMQAEST